MTRPTDLPAHSNALSKRSAFSSILVRTIWVYLTGSAIQVRSRIHSAECALTPMQSNLDQRYSLADSLTTGSRLIQKYYSEEVSLNVYKGNVLCSPHKWISMQKINEVEINT